MKVFATTAMLLILGALLNTANAQDCLQAGVDACTSSEFPVCCTYSAVEPVTGAPLQLGGCVASCDVCNADGAVPIPGGTGFQCAPAAIAQASMVALVGLASLAFASM